MTFKIIYCVVVVLALCIMWILAIKEWKRRETREEMRTLDERFPNPPAEAIKRFGWYEDSFRMIARHAYRGKHNAFLYAFKMGYFVGKEDGKNEKII